MNQSLHSYLRDHIAGAQMAVDVIGIVSEFAEPALAELLAWLLVEVQQDKTTLEQLAANLRTGASPLKNSAAHVAAAGASLKFRAGNSPFGMFEALEFLTLGILGKRQLWSALERSPGCAAAPNQLNQPNRPDFTALIRRAEAQYARVEDQRLVLASTAL